METFLQADFFLLNWIQLHLVNPFFDVFFKVITHLGDAGLFWIGLALILMIFKKTRKIGFVMGGALAIGFLITNVLIKPNVARARPYTFDQAVLQVEQLLIARPSDFSFPSGHTTASFAGATAIYLNSKKFGWAALLLAALVSFSRLYLYVHFPSDVLAGMAIGVFAGILSSIMIQKLAERKQKRI